MAKQIPRFLLHHSPHTEAMLLPMVYATLKSSPAFFKSQCIAVPGNLRIAANHLVMGHEIVHAEWTEIEARGLESVHGISLLDKSQTEIMNCRLVLFICQCQSYSETDQNSTG